eukprot:TRINITY_DN121779_c0_g1_i1.p1 TRINITY_DN121779_c0_g1~~TRINITY_DN121779_c0_g1_i1.p1  ORF type:complete len:659 (-),score=88.13 TRINITY_DN121779_c0_g1_i1:110-2086(-)
MMVKGLPEVLFGLQERYAQPLKTSFALAAALTPQTVSCESVGKDVAFHGTLRAKEVLCPAGCAKEGAPAYGASIHPMRSGVCRAAIVDGVLPAQGGRLLMTKVPGLSSYTGKDARVALSLAATDEKGDAFHVYAVDSIDQAKGDTRLVDEGGNVSSNGLLQVLTDKGFGTVCGASASAADVVCKQLGFSHGAVDVKPCSSVKGSPLCGALGSPVAMKNLNCEGREDSLGDPTCTWDAVRADDAECISHAKDITLKCYDNAFRDYGLDSEALYSTFQKGSETKFKDWQTRLMNADGTPSKDGIGRLEIFHRRHGEKPGTGHWGPICADNFTSGDAVVACRSMGYTSADVVNNKASCKGFRGRNLCSTERPMLDWPGCSGSEANFASCRGASEAGGGKLADSQCTPGNTAVVHCFGAGVPADKRMTGSPPPLTEPKMFPPKQDLGCEDSLESLGLDKVPPGTSLVVNCPAHCGDKNLAGSGIYSGSSSVCAAAKHAGILGKTPGDVMVSSGHAQDLYIGSEENGLKSADAAGDGKHSFTVALPAPQVLARVSKRFQDGVRYAGASAFGSGAKVGAALAASAAAAVNGPDEGEQSTGASTEGPSQDPESTKPSEAGMPEIIVPTMTFARSCIEVVCPSKEDQVNTAWRRCRRERSAASFLF